MLPYFYFELFLFLSSFYISNSDTIKKSTTTYFVFICCLLVTISFFGLRGFVFTDWINYFYHYNLIPTDLSTFFKFIGNPKNSSEIGFSFFQFLCKQISGNYFFLQFCSSLLDTIILCLFFKDLNPKNLLLCIFCIAPFKGLEIEINLLRNSKAIFLFLYSLRYIYREKSLKKYLLINLLGCTFHLSAILYLPLYFILDKKHSRLLYFIIFLVPVLIMSLKISFSYSVFTLLCNYIPAGNLLLKMTKYLENGLETPTVFSPISLERIITFILIILYYPKLIKNKTNIIFINIFVLYFLCAFIFWDFNVVSQRFSILFVASNWILIPEIISLFKKKNEKIIILLVFFTYCLFKLYKDVEHSPWLSYVNSFNEIDYSVKSAPLKKMGF